MTLRKTGLPKTALVIALVAVGFTGIANAQGHGRGHAPVSFAELDTDGDGQVTTAELGARGANRFAKTDTNSDGFLSADELEAAGKEKAAERAARMIEKLDADKDGKLSAEEMTKRGRGGDSNGRAAKMLERFDADKNGSLSEEEFRVAIEKMRERHGKKKQGE